MKKILIYLSIISVILNLFMVTILATGKQELVTAILNRDVKLVWNGDLFEPKDNEERLYPITYEGRTYVPVRAVAEKSGMSVDWDEPSKSILFGANFNADTGKYYNDSTYFKK